jgi:putative transcriptional regulator
VSAERLTHVIVGADGKPRRRLANGRLVRIKDRTDWKRLAAMTEREIVRNARSDPDAPLVPRARLKDFKRVTLSPAAIRSIRARTRLSQEAFARRFALNLRTLRDWEQGRVEPDGPARAYLLVIRHEPAAVKRALAVG